MKLVKSILRSVKLYDLVYYWYKLFQYRCQKPNISPPPHIYKQQCVIKHARKYDCSIFVETGTYRGDMIRAVRKHFTELWSIELGLSFYESACQSFGNDSSVHLLHGDSAEILPQLIKSLDRPCLFWLDAHYSGPGTAMGNKNTPILNELECILTAPAMSRKCLVLIDDARCFTGNNGYPTIEEIRCVVDSHIPSARLVVRDDIIRIIVNDI